MNADKLKMLINTLPVGDYQRWRVLEQAGVWQTYRRFYYGKPKLNWWKSAWDWLQRACGRVDERWACQVGTHYSQHTSEAAAWEEMERQVKELLGWGGNNVLGR